MQTLQKFEIAVSGLIIFICVVFLWESWDLPPGSFEPLGSGPVPQATAGVIILCCLWVIYSAFKTTPDAEDEEDAEEVVPIRISAGVLMALATLLFVIVLHFRLMAFSFMTVIFLTVTIWGLEQFNKKKFLPALITGVIIGFGVEYLFTQVFVVDLPTLF